MADKTFRTSINLKAAVRSKVIPLLNQQLADTFDLYSQTKQAHWNVKGMHFIALHELFDKLAAVLEPHIDEIAERVTTLGGLALGTVRMAAKSSTLDEFPNVVDDRACVEELVKRYAAVAASTRAAIDAADEAGDADTADLFTAISRDLDKSLWFLEAHLQS